MAFVRAVIAAFPSPVILVPAILAFALTGPFGTYDGLSFGQLGIYWGTAVLGCGFFFNAALLMVLNWGSVAEWPRAGRIALAALFASPFGAVLLYGLDTYFRGNSDGPDFFLWLIVCVFLIGFAVSLIQYRRPTPAELAFANLGRPPGLFDKLPAELGRRLLSMSMSDHYVQVVTDKGQHLVHARFADAMEQVGSITGLRCHRSHWIALDAIASAKLTGKNRHVILVDGRSVPVSDTYAPQVRAALDAQAAPNRVRDA